MFFILDSSFKRFENCTVKLSAKETKWTSLEVRTHPTFLENLISKYDFGPVKLPGLSRNGPLVTITSEIQETGTTIYRPYLGRPERLTIHIGMKRSAFQLR